MLLPGCAYSGLLSSPILQLEGQIQTCPRQDYFRSAFSLTSTL